jgi:sodium/pantothenate symporter
VNAYAWAIIISMAVYLVVGNYAGRKVKHLDDYYVAGRQAPTLLVVGTLVASLLSTAAFLGEVGMAYSGHGAVVLMLVAVNVIGYTSGAVLFGRYLRRSRALTVAEYFGQRFLSRRVQVVSGLTIVFGLGAYLVAVTQGAALIVTRVSDLSYATALIIVWLGYTALTMYAGSRGVVITDTMMFVLFTLVSYVALAFIVDASGGWFATIEALARFSDKPEIISWSGVTGPDSTWRTPAEALTWAVILGLAWAVVVAVSPWQASRYLMARSENTVLRAACGASLALLFLYPVLMLCGAAINLGKGDIEPPDTAMLWAAQNLMPPAAGALLMAGIMAAALSSATTFLSLVGFSAGNDVVRHATADDGKRLRLSRLYMVAIGLIVLLLAVVVPPRIFWITYFAGTVFASSWGPVALMSVWSSRITADAAFWGILSGFVGNVASKALSWLGIITLPVWADPIIIGAGLSLLVIALVSRRGSVSDAERAYRERLHEVPETELAPHELRLTRRWAAILAAGGLLLAALMILFWVVPYRAALDARGVTSGELWLSLGCGLILLGCGATIRWHLRGAGNEETDTLPP